MTTQTKLGIWMDHANAHLMEYTPDTIETKTLATHFTHQVKEDTLKKSEVLMHNKEQHQQTDYYKKLCDIIKNYKEVMLFGPTDAKMELLNILKADRHFDKIKVETVHADKMTENQQHAFVREHFSKNIRLGI